MPERYVFIPEIIERSSFNSVGSMLPTLSLSGTTMGTHWSLKYSSPADIKEASLQNAIELVFNTIIDQMSGWEPTSEISRFNKLPSGHCLPISQEFQTVLQRAIALRHETAGAFDPFCGVAVNAWGFGPQGLPGTLPSNNKAEQYAPAETLPALDKAGTLHQPGGIYIDLCAIAKGYAVDLCADTLEQLGIDSFLMEIGGEFKAKGVRSDAQPWWVTLETAPGTTGKHEAVIALYNLAVATSGAYRREATVGNRYTTHIIDPHLQQPKLGTLASVSVLHKNCMEADAYATALFSMGEEKGLAFANEHNLSAIFSRKDGQMALSSNAHKMLD